MHDSMAAILDIEDPEGLEPVKDAYCALTEVHTNYKTKSLIAIFECWRSRDAFNAERKPFTAIQLKFEPDKGGSDFFYQYGIDGANGSIGENILQFCLDNSDIMRDAKTLALKVAESAHE